MAATALTSLLPLDVAEAVAVSAHEMLTAEHEQTILSWEGRTCNDYPVLILVAENGLDPELSSNAHHLMESAWHATAQPQFPMPRTDFRPDPDCDESLQFLSDDDRRKIEPRLQSVHGGLGVMSGPWGDETVEHGGTVACVCLTGNSRGRLRLLKVAAAMLFRGGPIQGIGAPLRGMHKMWVRLHNCLQLICPYTSLDIITPEGATGPRYLPPPGTVGVRLPPTRPPMPAPETPPMPTRPLVPRPPATPPPRPECAAVCPSVPQLPCGIQSPPPPVYPKPCDAWWQAPCDPHQTRAWDTTEQPAIEDTPQEAQDLAARWDLAGIAGPEEPNRPPRQPQVPRDEPWVKRMLRTHHPLAVAKPGPKAKAVPKPSSKPVDAEDDGVDDVEEEDAPLQSSSTRRMVSGLPVPRKRRMLASTTSRRMPSMSPVEDEDVEEDDGVDDVEEEDAPLQSSSTRRMTSTTSRRMRSMRMTSATNPQDAWVNEVEEDGVDEDDEDEAPQDDDVVPWWEQTTTTEKATNAEKAESSQEEVEEDVDADVEEDDVDADVEDDDVDEDVEDEAPQDEWEQTTATEKATNAEKAESSQEEVRPWRKAANTKAETKVTEKAKQSVVQQCWDKHVKRRQRETELRKVARAANKNR